jgi:hypothetical protein
VRNAKRVAIVQSNYVPWKGYFDLIASVDEFILYDDAQYTVRDWRNRNRVKTRDGVAWLTIPVTWDGPGRPPIREVRAADPAWARKHWDRLRHAYSKAPCYREAADFLGPLYGAAPAESLSAINAFFLRAICGYLGITTVIRASMDYRVKHQTDPTKRLLAYCEAAGARVYVSGPSAKAYLDVESLRNAGVETAFFDYAGYAEYRQPYPPFIHEVSVLDLLFCEGRDAAGFVRRNQASRCASLSARATTVSVGFAKPA